MDEWGNAGAHDAVADALEATPGIRVLYVNHVEDELSTTTRDSIGIKLPDSDMTCRELRQLLIERSRQVGCELDPERYEIVVEVTYAEDRED